MGKPLIQGTTVIARCYENRAAVLKVWDDCGNMVLLSDHDNFDRLKAGVDAITPIGFLRRDLYEYSRSLDTQIANGDPLNWNSMARLSALSRQD